MSDFENLLLRLFSKYLLIIYFVLDTASSTVDFTWKKRDLGPSSRAYGQVGNRRWVAWYRFLSDEVPREEWVAKKDDLGWPPPGRFLLKQRVFLETESFSLENWPLEMSSCKLFLLLRPSILIPLLFLFLQEASWLVDWLASVSLPRQQ